MRGYDRKVLRRASRRLIAAFCLVAALAVGQPALPAQADDSLALWSDETIITKDQLIWDAEQMAVTSDGRTVVVWENKKFRTGPGLYMAVRDTGVWAAPEKLNIDASEVAIAAQGRRVLLVWRQLLVGRTVIRSQALLADGSWGPRRVVSRFSGDSPFERGLAVGANPEGGVVATWNGRFKFYASVRQPGQPWSQAEEIVGSQSWVNYEWTLGAESAFVTNDGTASLAFFDRHRRSGSGVVVLARHNPGGHWVTTRVTPDAAGKRAVEAFGISIDIDGEGNTVVVWGRRDPVYDVPVLLARSWNGGVLGSIENVARNATTPDVELGPNGAISLAFTAHRGGVDRVVLGSSNDGSIWTLQTVARSKSNGGLAVTESGDAVVIAHPSSYSRRSAFVRCPAAATCGTPTLIPNTAGNARYFRIGATPGDGAVVVWGHGCGTEECVTQSLRSRSMQPAA